MITDASSLINSRFCEALQINILRINEAQSSVPEYVIESYPPNGKPKPAKLTNAPSPHPGMELVELFNMIPSWRMLEGAKTFSNIDGR